MNKEYTKEMFDNILASYCKSEDRLMYYHLKVSCIEQILNVKSFEDIVKIKEYIWDIIKKQKGIGIKNE